MALILFIAFLFGYYGRRCAELVRQLDPDTNPSRSRPPLSHDATLVFVTDIYLDELGKNAALRRGLTEQRDKLITSANAAGVPVTHIAEALGLTRQHVHRILNGPYLAVFFEWPDMPPVGSMPVVAVRIDDEGDAPVELLDPLDNLNVPMPGRWIYDGRTDDGRTAIYRLA